MAGKAFADGRLDDALEGGGVAVIAALGAIPVFGKLKKLPEIAGRIARLAARLGGRKVATIADVEGEIAPALKRTRAQIKELRHLENQKNATRESLFAAKPGTTKRAELRRQLRRSQLRINRMNGAGYEGQSEKFLRRLGLKVSRDIKVHNTSAGGTKFDLRISDRKKSHALVEVKQGGGAKSARANKQKTKQLEAAEKIGLPRVLIEEGQKIKITRPPTKLKQ